MPLGANERYQVLGATGSVEKGPDHNNWSRTMVWIELDEKRKPKALFSKDSFGSGEKE